MKQEVKKRCDHAQRKKAHSADSSVWEVEGGRDSAGTFAIVLGWEGFRQIQA